MKKKLLKTLYAFILLLITIALGVLVYLVKENATLWSSTNEQIRLLKQERSERVNEINVKRESLQSGLDQDIEGSVYDQNIMAIQGLMKTNREIITLLSEVSELNLDLTIISDEYSPPTEDARLLDTHREISATLESMLLLNSIYQLSEQASDCSNAINYKANDKVIADKVALCIKFHEEIATIVDQTTELTETEKHNDYEIRYWKATLQLYKNLSTGDSTNAKKHKEEADKYDILRQKQQVSSEAELKRYNSELILSLGSE